MIINLNLLLDFMPTCVSMYIKIFRNRVQYCLNIEQEKEKKNIVKKFVENKRWSSAQVK